MPPTTLKLFALDMHKLDSAEAIYGPCVIGWPSELGADNPQFLIMRLSVSQSVGQCRPQLVSVARH